jgi:chemotaxis protein MotB
MAGSRRHRRGHDDHEEHENEERWLVSFADMMTLLFCLFMVLFALSSVNTSKFEELKRSLSQAFSGKILSGGKAIMETGAAEPPNKPQATPPIEAMSPVTALSETTVADKDEARLAQLEQEQFRQLKRRIDALAKAQGISGHVKTVIRSDGLIIELLTDKVFFDSGQATLKPPALRLLGKVGRIIAAERTHPVQVEGHTDSQPIHTDRYHSNWSLSGDRAAAVVEEFADNGVLSQRLSLKGYGSMKPVATNTTPQGRSRNRRVDVVLNRLHKP